MNSGYVVVGAASIVIGLLFGAVLFTHILPYQEDMRDVEEVDAVVLSSSVTQAQNSEGQVTYTPAVTYRYTYEGTEYTSDSIFPGDVDPVSDESRAREIVAQYPEGEEVTAYVNTEDPSTAFLIDEAPPLWFWLAPVVGVLAILYGLYSIVLGLRGVEHSAEPA